MAKDNLLKKDNKEQIWLDPRFTHLVNDPRFKHLPKSHKKVKIDKRFQPMFENEKFKLKYSVDKRGRKVNSTTSEDLRKYYDLSSESDDEEEEVKKEQEAVEERTSETDEFGNSLLDRGIKSKLKNLEIDYARGEAALISDSSSEEDSSEDDDKELVLDHVWGELDFDAPRTEDSSRRIAACNMDWDRIRAVDIMVLCHSFLPPGGMVKKVSVYPSEFGKERLKEEEITGPKELIEEVESESDLDNIQTKEEDAEESEYQREKLREYQLNRLKYFYAVIECDTVATADKLYAECDGMEYESTACKLDFRFIPDEVTFDEDEPREVCEELPDLSKYTPRIFTTKALQQGKVELTWDENDMERKEIHEKLLNGDLHDVPDEILKKYVAYSSSEEETEYEKNPEHNNLEEKDVPTEKTENKSKKNSIGKYKSLLNDINHQEERRKQQQIEREFTWGIGMESDLFSKKIEQVKQDQTPFEKIIEKKKEKRKARKEEIKRRRKGSQSDDSEQDLPEGIDMNDPYFAEEFTNENFEKSTKSKKASRKHLKSSDEDREHMNAELSLLLADGDEDTRPHFSLKTIQALENEKISSKTKRKFKKKKMRDIQQEKEKNRIQDDFSVNLTDERFKDVFQKPDFNIDPTNPQFKKTKNMKVLIQEKLKRKNDDQNSDISTEKQAKLDPAMSAIMKNIKRNIKG